MTHPVEVSGLGDERIGRSPWPHSCESARVQMVAGGLYRLRATRTSCRSRRSGLPIVLTWPIAPHSILSRTPMRQEERTVGRRDNAIGPNEEAGPRHGVQHPLSRGAPLAKDESDGVGEGGVSREAPAEDDNPPRMKDRPARAAVEDDPPRLSECHTPPVVDDDPLRLAGGHARPVVDGGRPRQADRLVRPVVHEDPPGLAERPVRSARTNVPG